MQSDSADSGVGGCELVWLQRQQSYITHLPSSCHHRGSRVCTETLVTFFVILVVTELIIL